MYKLSKYISTILHPVLLPTIATLVFFLVSPFYYPLNHIYILITFVFLGSYIFPILLLILFKKLQIISSFEIMSTHERKIPVLSFLIISLILSYVIYNLPNYKILSLMFFGCFLALSIIYFLLYFNIKASLHITGMSGFMAFIILLSHYFQINLIGLIALLFFLTGLLATARIILDAHKPTELVMGFLIGTLSLLAVTLIL